MMPRRSSLPVIALCVLFAALTLPMAWLGRVGTSEAVDQNDYHWPTILAMSEDWPAVSLDEYRTATGPLYHALLAGIVWLTGADQAPIRVINALLSLVLIVAVHMLVSRRVGSWLAVLFTLPLAFSAYVLSSAIWITTDNFGLAFVVLALVAATANSARPVRGAVGSAVFAALATAVRQIALWVVAPCAFAAFLHRMREPNRGIIRNGIIADTVAVPAIIVIALLYWWWGGLTPPLFEKHAPTGQPFAIGFTLSLIGMFGVFFLPVMRPQGDRSLWRSWPAFACVAIAVAITVVQPTTLDKDAGRWAGPIWALVDHLPAVADRSIVFPPLAALGAIVLLAGFRRAASLGRSFDASVLLIAVMCFAVSHAVQPWCAQRYFEPIVLVFVAWLASLCVEPAASSESLKLVPVRLWLGPAVLSAFQLALSGYAVYWQSRLVDMT